MLVEWTGRGNNYAIEKLGFKWTKSLRWGIYICIIVAILWFGEESQDFIYFQF